MAKEPEFTLAEVTGYLQSKGVPKSMIRWIRLKLTSDAVKQAESIHFDRVYTAAALALCEAYKPTQKRIMEFLQAFSDIFVQCGDAEETWPELMERLKGEHGIVVRNGDGDRLVVEVLTDEEKENYKGVYVYE